MVERGRTWHCTQRGWPGLGRMGVNGWHGPISTGQELRAGFAISGPRVYLTLCRCRAWLFALFQTPASKLTVRAKIRGMDVYRVLSCK